MADEAGTTLAPLYDLVGRPAAREGTKSIAPLNDEGMPETVNDVKVWIAQADLLGISIDPKQFSEGLVQGVPSGYKHLVFNADQLRALIAELQDRLIQTE